MQGYRRALTHVISTHQNYNKGPNEQTLELLNTNQYKLTKMTFFGVLLLK